MRKSKILLAIALAFLLGCGNGGESDESSSGAHALDTIAAPVDTIAESAKTPDPTNERFLGYVTIEADRPTFTACGTNERTWILDLTGQELTDVYKSLMINPGEPIFMEFIGLREPAPEVGFGAEYTSQIKVLELLRAALEGPGCDENLSAVLFRARGNEPFWRVDVTRHAILFSDFGRSLKIRLPYTQATETETGWRIRSSTARPDAHDITIDLDRDSCNDSMSGAYFHLTAEVELDGYTYLGCAVQGW